MTDMRIEVIRSKRRKRTVQATLKDGRLEVRVPDGLNRAEEARLVDQVTSKVQRKLTSKSVDLGERATRLARRYDLPTPARVEWSGRQMRRWGSCTPTERAIRISNRLASMPGWVLDSVIVHELAHLEEAGHGPRFQELVGRYRLTERAKGYLIAKDEQGPIPTHPEEALHG